MDCRDAAVRASRCFAGRAPSPFSVVPVPSLFERLCRCPENAGHAMRRCFFRMPQTVRTCGGMRSAASGTETHCRSVFGNAEAFGIGRTGAFPVCRMRRAHVLFAGAGTVERNSTFFAIFVSAICEGCNIRTMIHRLFPDSRNFDIFATR